MIEVGTMIVPTSGTAAKGPNDHREANRQTNRETRRRCASPLSSPALTELEPGATVFIGGGGRGGGGGGNDELQESRESSGYALTSRQQRQQRQQSQQAAHVVKIKINPDDDKNGRVISTVRLTLDENNRLEGECSDAEPLVPASVSKRISGNSEERQQQRTCLRINVLTSDTSATGTVVVGGAAGAGTGAGAIAIAIANADRNGNGESNGVPNTEATCNGTADANVNEAAVKSDSTSNYFYNPCQSPVPVSMVMSSGQCSPSDTLDSGTCSDLDGTPPPLPKKKNANGKLAAPRKAEPLSSSGAEIDSDDNESNISCDSLNGAARSAEAGAEAGAEASAEEKAKQKTGLEDEGCWDVVVGHSVAAEKNAARTPVVRECTYEERKLEQARLEQENAAADFYANYNRSNGTKYLYDDDRFYKFHVNELRSEDEELSGGEQPATNKHTDESFAGYKLLEREAIRSAKGTVRGVKNRVRAGIATFLQKPSTKDYKAKDAGKVVVYTTTSGIIRSSYYNCIKVNQILRTHMAKYEERDLFRSMEHQTELKDRLNCSTIELPQLFIDGQYIGDVETVDRLNETGELRRLLKPYKVETKISFAVCALCGGFRMLLCEQCNGSKRSVFRNGFTTEFVGLRCMKCNEVGLVPCYRCNI